MWQSAWAGLGTAATQPPSSALSRNGSWHRSPGPSGSPACRDRRSSPIGPSSSYPFSTAPKPGPSPVRIENPNTCASAADCRFRPPAPCAPQSLPAAAWPFCRIIKSPRMSLCDACYAFCRTGRCPREASTQCFPKSATDRARWRSSSTPSGPGFELPKSEHHRGLDVPLGHCPVGLEQARFELRTHLYESMASIKTDRPLSRGPGTHQNTLPAILTQQIFDQRRPDTLPLQLRQHISVTDQTDIPYTLDTHHAHQHIREFISGEHHPRDDLAFQLLTRHVRLMPTIIRDGATVDARRRIDDRQKRPKVRLEAGTNDRHAPLRLKGRDKSRDPQHRRLGKNCSLSRCSTRAS